MKKFMLYLPYSEFFNYYDHKALGEIPLGFQKIGYDSEILVGQMKSETYRKTGIKIFETGNLDTAYIVDSRSMKIIPRIKNFLDFKEFRKALKYIKQENPDIIMAYNNSTLTPFIIIAYKICLLFRRKKSRILLKLDNDGSKIEAMPGFRKIINYAYYFFLSRIFDSIITETTCGEKIFKKIPGMKNKIRVVPNSVDDSFTPLNLPRAKKIISVSRIIPVKKIDVLIKAFSLVSQNYPDWELYIIGGINDRNYFQELEKLVKDLNLLDKIKFTGPYNVNQLKEAYSTAFIFCLLSLEESFAISRLEAISMGMHIVSSDAGCATDFLKYGIKIVKTDDTTGTASAIIEYISLYGKEKISNNGMRIPSYADIATIMSGPNF